MPHAVTFHVPRPSTRSMIFLSCFSMFFIQCLLLQVQRNRSVILQCGVPALLTNAMTLHVTSVAPLMRWWPQEASARCWPVMMELPALAWMKFGPWVTLTWRPFSTTWSHCWYWCISLCFIVIYRQSTSNSVFSFLLHRSSLSFAALFQTQLSSCCLQPEVGLSTAGVEHPDDELSACHHRQLPALLEKTDVNSDMIQSRVPLGDASHCLRAVSQGWYVRKHATAVPLLCHVLQFPEFAPKASCDSYCTPGCSYNAK